MNLISKLDQKFSVWIKQNIHNPTLSWVLSRVNRGEVFGLILIPLMILSERYSPAYYSIPYMILFTYITDRSVLVLKKYFARKRPLISVMGKVDSNPDMKHSFPSAHSANSIVVATMLVFIYSETPCFYFFSLFAGLGRLITLHHFFSDILGGWFIGFLIGIIGYLIYTYLIPMAI